MDEIAKHRLDRALSALVNLVGEDDFKGKRLKNSNFIYKDALNSIVDIVNIKENHKFSKKSLEGFKKFLRNFRVGIGKSKEDVGKAQKYEEWYEQIDDFTSYYEVGGTNATKYYGVIDRDLTVAEKEYRTEAKKQLKMICKTSCY